MNTTELDKRIGMPDIDAEWAKFEKNVMGTTAAGKKRTFLQSWTARAAAIAGIIFLLGGAIASAVILSKSNAKFSALFANDDPIYDVVEEAPQYAEGTDAMWQFFIRNLHYPQAAQECGVYGRVLVRFVVEKDGRCTQFKVVKPALSHQKHIKRNVPATGSPKDRDFITPEEFEAAQKACSDEALRVCRLMSDKWTPGKIKGEAVRSRFTMPITFRLK